MTEQTIDAQQDVLAFVERVQALMSDLPADERRELTAGLAADLSELVADLGPDRLGDPADYARELRVAAGHPPEMGRTTRPGRLRAAAMDALDTGHASWDRMLDALPYGGPRAFLTALQPAWWVARALIAWTVAQDVRGPYVEADTFWLAWLAVFVVVSVQVGRRRWGTGRLLSGSVLVRLLLVACNVGLVLALPDAMDRTGYAITEHYLWQYCSDCGY